MDLTFTDEQLLLKNSAERYLTQRYSFADRHRYLANPKGWDPGVWADFSEFGWLSLPFEIEHGGLGAGAVEMAILAQEFGRVLVLEPYGTSIVLCGYLLERLATTKQQSAWLTELISGTSVFAFAHDEPASRLTPGPVTVQALRHQDNWLLSGVKTLVRSAGSADYFLVTATVSASGPGSTQGDAALFVVPASAVGLKLTPYGLIDGSQAGDLTLHQVAVSVEHQLTGQPGPNHVNSIAALIRSANERAVVFAAAQASGCMRAALDATVSYTKTRQQFGRPLAANQVIKHRLVDMAIACEEASAIAFRAALLGDTASANAAKLKVSRAARLVAEQSIQLHGGMGVTEELNIGAYFKQLLAFEMSFGSNRHLAQEQFTYLRSRALEMAAFEVAA